MNLGDLYLEKERYVDAAEAYEAFVAQDPFHPKAPLLQVEVIEAYKQGGFPSLVLDGKKGFVERYGMDGPVLGAQSARREHRRRGAPEGEPDRSRAVLPRRRRRRTARSATTAKRPLVSQVPRVLPGGAGQRQHQLPARRDSVRESGLRGGDDRVRAHRLRLSDAREVGRGRLRRDSGLPRAREDARRRCARRMASGYLDSGLRFADTYPEHPESGAVLTTIAEDLFAQNQFDLAIAVGQAVVGKQPPVEPELARTAWTVIAHSQFDLGNFAEAEQSYYQLRTFTPVDDAEAGQEIKDRIASSIYKQGEQARDMGDLETAVTHFTRLGQVVPDSDIRATAEYDAAAALINLQAWDRAAGQLEQFRRDYPDSEFADDVTQKLAVSYLESGRGVEAAREFERIAADPNSDDEVRREALWKAAELYKESPAQSERATRARQDIVARYPNPLSESIEARYRLLEIARATGDNADRYARGCRISCRPTPLPARSGPIARASWPRRRRSNWPSPFAGASRWSS